MSSIELDAVSKRFGLVEVISGLSLSIGAGEFVAFLGPSGCGKSTLLRMIAGLETVDGGQIHIGDRRVDNLHASERGVAMVFQHYALYPHMSVYDNLAFGLRNISVAKAEIVIRIQTAAKLLEIEQLLQRKPEQLSGGQRQRVAIGRAIVKNPKVFLFDEPLSNLDAALRVRTRVELARLHQKIRTTTIFVTHDQVEAMTLAERIVVLNERKVEQVGTPMEIYSRPATEFVARFVGSPPMNFLSAQVDGSGAFGKARLAVGSEILTQIPASALDPALKYRLGVRPENIRVDTTGDLPGKVEVVERLGDRTLLHLRLNDGELIVAEDHGGSKASISDQMNLRISPEAALLFDDAGRAYHPN